MISVDLSLFRGVFAVLLVLQVTATAPNTTLFESEVAKLGYAMETHTVETEDFFLLTVFRLGGKTGINFLGKPLLLTHGLDESADIWILNEVDKCVAFVLANAGYDVWLLNNRGTAYSRGHKKFNVKQAEFWNFSFQEMASFDIPATLDTILSKSFGKKVTIIGHSQGATQALAALTDPQLRHLVDSKIKAVVGLSPAVDMGSPDFLRRQVFNAISLYVPLRKLLGVHYPFFSSAVNTKFKDFMRTVCQWSTKICEGIMYFPGFNPKCNDSKLLGKLLSVLPAGASFRSYSHFEQLYRFSTKPSVLRKYDFGTAEENLKVYNSPVPPVYDWTLLNVPVFMHSGYDDTLTPHEGISMLVHDLRKLGKDVSALFYKDWDHFSPIMSPDPSLMLFNLLQDLQKVHRQD